LRENEKRRKQMEEELDLKVKLIELRKSTGMNRRQFCEYFEIPYMTVSDWEHGNRRVPAYFFRLLEYYVRMELMEKEDTGGKEADLLMQHCLE
jgi:putative transcriptional regulator